MSSSKMYRLILFFTLCIVFFSCQDNEYLYPCKSSRGKCNYNNETILPSLVFPAFKSGSNNEFIYLKMVEDELMCISHFDIENRIGRDILCGIKILGQPSYDASGWICFATKSWKIWRINSTLLT